MEGSRGEPALRAPSLRGPAALWAGGCGPPSLPEPPALKGVAPAQPVPPRGPSLDLNSSVEGPRLRQLLSPHPPLGSWAPLPVWAQPAQPRGCPGPLENTWSHWAVMAHAMGPPPPHWCSQAAPMPIHSSSPPVLSTCFQDPMVPWRTLPGQSPKPLGRSQSPLDRRHLSIHLIGQEQTLLWDVRPTFVPPAPNFQGLLLSQLHENRGAMGQTREESVCPCMPEYAWQRLHQQLCVQRLYV